MQSINVGRLCYCVPVNNVGMMPSVVPRRFLEDEALDQVSRDQEVDKYIDMSDDEKLLQVLFKWCSGWYPNSFSRYLYLFILTYTCNIWKQLKVRRSFTLKASSKPITSPKCSLLLITLHSIFFSKIRWLQCLLSSLTDNREGDKL